MTAVVAKPVRALLVIAALAGSGVILFRSGLVAAFVNGATSVRTPAPAHVPPIDRSGMTIGSRFAPPEGYERTPAAPRSYAAYLRELPLKPDGSPVRLYSGQMKRRQDVHAAVLDLDPGTRDLQQCADAAIRLRAEYLFGVGRMDDISFHFTSGFPCGFAEWRRGRRVAVSGSHVEWTEGGLADASAATLRSYLETVFTYAGTASLPRDVDSVADPRRPEPGDLYLKPGSPGHAMTVVDVATRGTSRVILLAQSYMPAQEIHVVRNPAAPAGEAWFLVNAGPTLVTPEWTFAWSALRRFKGAP